LIHHSTRLYQAVLTMASVWLIGFDNSAWADCRTHYNDALALLNNTTRKAAENQHPNADVFAADFKTIVDKMQTEKCMPELMSLIQHIRAEQQKLPPPSEETTKKPLPIVD
jgi:hypothetical protein